MKISQWHNKFIAGKPISISLSPNTEKDDVRLAFRLIFQPWLWKTNHYENTSRSVELEEEFKKYFNTKYAISFNSGRSAFYAILRSLDFPEDSPLEVLLQAFTCNAVPNPILWAGLKPIYVDVNLETFNIDTEDLKRTLRQTQGKKPKVLVVQHSFGLPAFAKASAGKPADIDEILKICEEYNLILIEDCALSLGSEYKGKKIGTFGKAAFFSFGRDKVISSVFGGMAITNDPSLAEKIRQVKGKLSYPPHYWIFRQLLHPVLMNWVILPIYNFLDLGKIFLVLSQLLNILPKAIHWKEKKGEIPSIFPKKMPNALAILALRQFKKLGKFYQHRKELSQFYYDSLKNSSFGLSQNLSPEFLEKQGIKHAFLRFTIKHPRAHEIIYEAWHKKNILIGDWYMSPIAPFDTDLEKMQYIQGSCPNAEKLAKTTLNLPTHINISQKDAQRIVDFLKEKEKFC